MPNLELAWHYPREVQHVEAGGGKDDLDVHVAAAHSKQGYNNLRLDNTLLQARLLGWDMWITNVTGYLYCTIVMLPHLSLFPPR